jgi:hypothetical protein
MLSRLNNSELAYDSILVTNTIVVIVEDKINYRLRTGDNLSDGGKVIVGIRYFCLREIGRITGRERLTGYKITLKSTVIYQARYIHRRKIEASGTTERCNV